jgi:hypothetical protein
VILPILLLGLTPFFLQDYPDQSAGGFNPHENATPVFDYPTTSSVYGLKRDPFYISEVPVGKKSRYDISSPRVKGIISVDGVYGAIVLFDDKTEVVHVGDVVKGYVIVSIEQKKVVVKNGAMEEKIWTM